MSTRSATAAGGRDAVHADTIFRISSMTKPVTAVADPGAPRGVRPSPRRPGRRPAARAGRPPRRAAHRRPASTTPCPRRRAITVRDLLTFRDGIRRLLRALPGQRGRRVAAAERRTARTGVACLTPTSGCGGSRPCRSCASPGERWLYHTGADVLGVLIARASGQPFEAFLRERVFEPLGMRDTGFMRPRRRPRRDARPATRPIPSPVRSTSTTSPTASGRRRPPSPRAAAGLVSTAADYLAFAEMLLRGGAPGRVRGPRWRR